MRREEAVQAARRALDPGPDPYAHLDARLATRLGGAILLIGVAYVLIVLPLAPPDRGTGGWIGVGLCLALAIGTGVAMLKWPRPMEPETLLALTYGGIFLAAAYRWAAGSGAPFHQLLLLACLYGAAVHPVDRAFLVLAATSAAALSPVLYESVDGEFAALVAGHLALSWSLGTLILVWTTRVRSMRREVQEAREQADQLARIDALTGLGNRRALEEALPVAIAAARRADVPLSVIVADLDDFKGVNDTFGHHAGDDILRGVAGAFASSVRLPDPCFRWGGDEFVVLLPGADEPRARDICDRIAAAVAAACERPDGLRAAITAGTAQLRPDESGNELVARADAALLEAKARRALQPARI